MIVFIVSLPAMLVTIFPLCGKHKGDAAGLRIWEDPQHLYLPLGLCEAGEDVLEELSG